MSGPIKLEGSFLTNGPRLQLVSEGPNPDVSWTAAASTYHLMAWFWTSPFWSSSAFTTWSTVRDAAL